MNYWRIYFLLVVFMMSLVCCDHEPLVMDDDMMMVDTSGVDTTVLDTMTIDTTVVDTMVVDTVMMYIEAPCDTFPPSTNPFGGYQYAYEEVDYEACCFNPLNNQQIACVKRVNFWIAGLVIIDLVSQEETMLLEDNVRAPQWSSQNWIMFGLLNNRLYKIKSNGDSLQHLTAVTHGVNYNAKWSADGEQIVFVSNRDIFKW